MKMRKGRGKGTDIGNLYDPEPSEEFPSPALLNPQGVAIGGWAPLSQGPLPPPTHDNQPTTFNRFATRWGDLQLRNGLANRVASGQINGYRGEGWYDVAAPTIPGQQRLISGRVGDFPARGPAPSQWSANVANGPGSQPDYPGGPGYLMGGSLINPGSGG